MFFEKVFKTSGYKERICMVRKLILTGAVITLMFTVMGFALKFFMPGVSGTDVSEVHKVSDMDITPYMRMNLAEDKDRETAGIIGDDVDDMKNITTILNDDKVGTVDGYYLMELDGTAAVLTGDKNLYMCTDIQTTAFPLNDRVRIHYGMHFNSLYELFSFLESYE